MSESAKETWREAYLEAAMRVHEPDYQAERGQHRGVPASWVEGKWKIPPPQTAEFCQPAAGEPEFKDLFERVAGIADRIDVRQRAASKSSCLR